jgi:AraC family transcriptional regulator
MLDACEFLAHHLIYRYSSLSRPPLRSVGGLSSRRLRLVLEYIEDTLDRPIKLRDLAALAGVSARHFERALHRSTGSSPHVYVMERRLRMARDLLINQPELPVEQIASVGVFEQQSFLISVSSTDRVYINELSEGLVAVDGSPLHDRRNKAFI